MKKRRKFKVSRARREQVKKANRKWRSSPQGAYVTQRVNAERRGIEWQFTFETWWRLWESSGHWPERGRRIGRYCMARLGDCGPYAPFNCLIVLHADNSLAAMITAGLIGPQCAPQSCELARNYR